MPGSIFYAGVVQSPYENGIAAAGDVQYLLADVALTGSNVRQFSFPALIGVPYMFEACLFLDVSGAGTLTTNVGITGGSPVIRHTQLAQTTATALEQRSSFGTGAQQIVSSSLGTGNKTVLVRGSALKMTAGGVLFLDVATGGTANLLAGSTFRVFRAPLAPG